MIVADRTYQAFFTKSQPIVDYMVQMLSPQQGDRILEPCAGDGVFIEAILSLAMNVAIDAYEFNPHSIKTLNNKFAFNPRVKVTQSDTLLDADLSLGSIAGGRYDKIIANPPYGAWQDYEKRKLLKKLYPSQYVKETYSLFLQLGIALLKEKGRLVFIIPDTFLNLHLHKALRKEILTKTKIREILLFPSSFFPGVSFGYANLCIITLEKDLSEEKCLKNSFSVVSGFKQVEEFNRLDLIHLNKKIIDQRTIFGSVDHAFLIGNDEKLINFINSCDNRIGDMAKCVTGFYSGDDKEYLKVLSKDQRNGVKYDVVDKSKIATDYNGLGEILLNGIKGKRCFVPIVKGGNTKYIKPDMWFMNWSEEAVKHYKTDKKARFQNSQFYFKTGIGVPMISSSQITAALIEGKLFDQSIVGVFPYDAKYNYFLLAFFNSPTCNKLIRIINPSTNNPANYIKKIPFVEPGAEILLKVNGIVKKILIQIATTGTYLPGKESELNKLIEESQGF